MKLAILWSIVFVLAIICLILKKRIRWISAIILTFTITFFSILTPQGKLLAEFWNIHITSDSLENGLFKSGILLALQFFSKIVISSKIHFKGKVGIFINRIFAIYEKLTQEKFRKSNQENKKLKNIFDAIDERLISVWNQDIL